MFWVICKERKNRAFEVCVSDMASIRYRWINVFRTLILVYDIYGWDDFGKVIGGVYYIHILFNLKKYAFVPCLQYVSFSSKFFANKIILTTLHGNHEVNLLNGNHEVNLLSCYFYLSCSSIALSNENFVQV